MALTNHCLVRMAGHLQGFNKYSRYMIIGDDIVIFDENVAYEYIKLLNSLGVKYNEDDSVLPKVEKPYEIAKRLFRKGKEVSPFPFNLDLTNKSLFCWVYLDRYLTETRANPDRIPLRSLVAALLMFYYLNKDN